MGKLNNGGPRLAKSLLNMLLRGPDRQAVIGDFEEAYRERLLDQGRRIAGLWYWGHALRSIPLAVLNRSLWGWDMFSHHLKVAFRNMRRQKVYTVVNITGLAVGLACTIFIKLWLQDEFDYDRFHKNANRIGRLYGEHNAQPIWPGTPGPLAKALEFSIPGIRRSARGHDTSGIFKWKEKRFKLNGWFLEPAFFEIFSFSFIKGDPGTALNDVGNIVITESTAKRFFGDENPMGKVLVLNNQHSHNVTGVIRDIPVKSSVLIGCEFILPFQIMRFWRQVDDWTADTDYAAWILLEENASFDEVETKIDQLLQITRPNPDQRYRIQPLLSMHLHPIRFLYPESHQYGNIQVVVLFTGIACLVLLIACINFINLSMARAMRRAKEIGVRKVMGADRQHLLKQLFGETLCFILLAAGIACLLVILFLPQFNALSGKAVSFDLSNMKISFGLLALLVSTGILSGLYPAMTLSAFQPVTILKASGGIRIGSRNSFRKVLVVIQFIASISVLIGMVTIYRQLGFIREKELGYDAENILYFGMGIDYDQAQLDSFRNALLENPRILHVSRSTSVPSYIGWLNTIAWEQHGETRYIGLRRMGVDSDFMKTFGMEMAAGRFYSPDHITDAEETFIVNEAAVRLMNIEDPIGVQLRLSGKTGRIIGVIEDFHFASMREEILPLALSMERSPYFWCMKIAPVEMEDTVEYIRRMIRTYIPEIPFDYHFLDVEIDRLYRGEYRVGHVFTVFSVIAFLISCLGLFGLTAFISEQKTKEIGIRKVLGASMSRVTVFFSRVFIGWILIANFLAWPLAWLIMERWLRNFAYRINLSWWIFPLSGGIALLIALLTLSYHSIKAGRANPVDTLRNE